LIYVKNKLFIFHFKYINIFKIENKEETFIFNEFNVPVKFSGTKYRICNLWEPIFFEVYKLDLNEMKNTPIKYCEIGVFYAVNFITFEKTYGNHTDSELVAIDPWLNYSDYPEYKNKNMEDIYITAMNNMKLNDVDMNKVKVIRDYSHKGISLFEDNYFDIIYIDGNHQTYAVIEDLVLSFRKLKSGGIIICDDTHDSTIKNVVINFISFYSCKIKNSVEHNGQIFFQKI